MRIGPIDIAPRRIWKLMLGKPSWFNDYRHPYIGLFKNTNIRGTRWGLYIYGFEFGSHNPDSKFGAWLKRNGLWPW